MIKPITPDEVAQHKMEVIPDKVIEIFNRLIAENFTGGSAKVTQKQVVDAISQEMGGPGNLAWLNVEEIYRNAGWNVKYDKPGYNETYGAYYRFSKTY